VVAVDGTVAVINVSDQTAVAKTPLNVTVLLPWAAPKPLPRICTELFAAPVDGDSEVTTGFGIVNTTF
jgi:hypothetical protein